mgnify:CR=1 FL=1
MSCCREHEIYLNWSNQYDEEIIRHSLVELFGWTFLQSQIVIETARRNNKCLLIREGDERVSQLTLEMAKRGILFTVSKIDLVK